VSDAAFPIFAPAALPQARWRRWCGGTVVSAALLAVYVPGIVLTLTVLVYVARDDKALGLETFVVGLAGGLVAWLVCAVTLCRRGTVRNAHACVFADIRNDLVLQQERFDAVTISSGSARYLEEARAHLKVVTHALADDSASFRWAFGAGYVDLYRHLHRAEEALLLLIDDEERASEAIWDVDRLRESHVPDEAILVGRATRAVHALSPRAAEYLTGGDRRCPPLFGRQATEIDRDCVARVRRAVNDYRDANRAGLVRACSKLTLVTLVTGVLAYAIIALAVLCDAPVESIETAAAFFLVGGTVGLFQQLYLACSRTPVVVDQEDFGFASMHLRATPLLCGMAGVGGAFLTAVVGSHVGSDQAAPPKLHEIFSLTPIGLVTAAVFGLTPQSLLARVTSIGSSFQAGLKSTEAARADATNGGR
jgi:hypothetical protein